MPEVVRFSVEGSDVEGDVYLPADLPSGQGRPAVVAGNGFGATRATLIRQGEYLSEAGYVVLTIDYRGFGGSDGPRGELFPDRQMSDFSAAISYLRTRQEVEAGRIALWGTSFGGAVALGAAARDRRARLVIAQVPITDGRRWMKWLRSPEQWEELLEAVDEDRTRRFSGQPSRRVPTVAHFTDNVVCGLPTSQDVVDFTLSRPGRDPDIALESLEKIISFNPTSTIQQISPRPVCMIMDTGYEVMHPVDQVMDAYAAAAEPKKLVLLPFDQLGFYAQEGQDAALAAALGFLQENLPVGRQEGGEPPRSNFANS